MARRPRRNSTTPLAVTPRPFVEYSDVPSKLDSQPMTTDAGSSSATSKRCRSTPPLRPSEPLAEPRNYDPVTSSSVTLGSQACATGFVCSNAPDDSATSKHFALRCTPRSKPSGTTPDPTKSSQHEFGSKVRRTGWDIETIGDAGLVLPPETTAIVINNLAMIARFTGKPTGVDHTVHVRVLPGP
jgi:hypothetical protein